MKSLEEITQILKKAKPTLYDEYGVKLLGLFGSYARNEAQENSDIDLLVEFTNPKGFKTIEAWDYLQNLLGGKVDLVSQKYLREKLKQYIQEDILYV